MTSLDRFLMIVLLISLAYQLFYQLRFMTKILGYTPAPRQTPRPVSLIIAARNEAGNLQKHLPLWLHQNHPDYEIIIINDGSTDRTEEVLDRFASEKKLKVIRVKTSAGKKQALTRGILSARNEYLIFTDADCRPATENWLALMSSRFNRNKEIILGYGKYEVRTGWLNLMIRFETVITALQYLGFALHGLPYMGVGRNLAYTRSLFAQNKGFEKHYDLLSGDDDLFVNENATSRNTSICIHPNAHTVSVPNTTWKDYIHQKSRHYTTAYRYRNIHKIFLFLYASTQVLVWFVALYFLFDPGYRLYAAGILAVKILISASIIHRGAKKLNDPVPAYLVPILEIQLVILQMIIFVRNMIKKTTSWH